jgi:hypothetical protein
LPREILFRILEHSSIVDIYRLSLTSKYFREISQDSILWEKKFYSDFFSRSGSKKLNLDYKFLYKQKYLILETVQEKDYRKGVNFIIKHEFLLSFYRSYFLLMLPFKILGFLTLEIYEILYYYKPLLNAHSTGIDLTRLDLLEFLKKFKNWQNYEILLIGIIISLLLFVSSFLVNVLYFIVSSILGILKIPSLIQELFVFSCSIYILRSSFIVIPVLCSVNQKFMERNLSDWNFLRFFNFTLEILFSIQIYFLFSSLKVLAEVSNGEYCNFNMIN